MVEWIARSRVDGRPIRTTCGTDQQVIRTGVDLAQDTFIIDTVLLKKFRTQFLVSIINVDNDQRDRNLYAKMPKKFYSRNVIKVSKEDRASNLVICKEMSHLWYYRSTLYSRT